MVKIAVSLRGRNEAKNVPAPEMSFVYISNSSLGLIQFSVQKSPMSNLSPGFIAERVALCPHADIVVRGFIIEDAPHTYSLQL